MEATLWLGDAFWRLVVFIISHKSCWHVSFHNFHTASLSIDQVAELLDALTPLVSAQSSGKAVMSQIVKACFHFDPDTP